jgi:hypothetical protein
MVDILHRIGVEGSTPEKVYDAVTTLDGLSGWWMEKTSGNADLGGVIEFRIGLDVRVAELDPGRLVRWQVVAGPAEWVGTSIRWDLRQDGDWTIVLFKHEGWREPVEFMHHCSTKWATYLISLKQLVETGVGAPHPRGARISDWDPRAGAAASHTEIRSATGARSGRT